MPSDKPIQRLNDILENIDWIFQYTKGLRFRNFVEDRLVRDAVERCLLRISEAAKKLEGIVDKLAPGQPWSDIRSLGNAIRHEYDSTMLRPFGISSKTTSSHLRMPWKPQSRNLNTESRR